jgi:hypothetical protein
MAHLQHPLEFGRCSGILVHTHGDMVADQAYPCLSLSLSLPLPLRVVWFINQGSRVGLPTLSWNNESPGASVQARVRLGHLHWGACANPRSLHKRFWPTRVAAANILEP